MSSDPPSETLGIVYFYISSLLHYNISQFLNHSNEYFIYLNFSMIFYQQTPLHIAVKEFRMRTVEFLVDKGADINYKDNNGVRLLTDL